MMEEDSVNTQADCALDDASDSSSVQLSALASLALLKARGSSSRTLNMSSSLKSTLGIDRYTFISDTDLQEAQLQVDDKLLMGLLSVDDTERPKNVFTAQSGNILAVSPVLPQAMKRANWSLEDYVPLKKLHEGYASDVFKAQCKVSNETVALKVYKLSEQCDLQRVQLYREIRVHSQLQHPNIIQFYAAFLEDQNVVLVQEYLDGGDLRSFIDRNKGPLMERQTVNLVLQPFLLALQYLHEQGIAHRDIKPENIMLTSQNQLKLGDFGLAIDLNEERANTRAGTLEFMAPEVLYCPNKTSPENGKTNPRGAQYDLGADTWAVGVFAYELIVGARPFVANSKLGIARNIIKGSVHYPNHMSDQAKDFISQAFAKHAGDRPTVVDMLSHPWITMYQRRSSINCMYRRSNSIMEMLSHQYSSGNQKERALERSASAVGTETGMQRKVLYKKQMSLSRHVAATYM